MRMTNIFTSFQKERNYGSVRADRSDRSVLADIVRPGTVGLLIDIECSRVRDSSWMYLTSFVTTRIGIELAAVQKKLPDCVIV